MHLPLLLLALLLLALPCLGGEELDHRAIKQLRDQGAILPLNILLQNYRRDYPGGRILETELELTSSGYVYEIKFLTPDGTVRELEYDARDGELLAVEVPVRGPDGRIREYKYHPRSGELLEIEEDD